MMPNILQVAVLSFFTYLLFLRVNNFLDYPSYISDFLTRLIGSSHGTIYDRASSYEYDKKMASINDA
jgi:hypothetical protein